MARKKGEGATFTPHYSGELPCGCFHPKNGAIRYCKSHKHRYPLATGVVKTVKEKKELLEARRVRFLHISKEKKG